MENKNVIMEKSFAFALQIIEYTEEMESQKKYVLSRQLLRSGTSIGANIREAQSCESRADFIHKLSIALKEANETEYWLMLLHDTDYLDGKSFQSIIIDCRELIKLLVSIIKTAKKGKGIDN